ncbi:uncharacterized protein BP5553_06383 [Venustampulla echinocandica]|uniref:EKC/KEOPS complex subunit BUD32 n=1 Tax=Venustampulla echinocandica TaxID=2656787 RepID=A0A370TJR6_9HELO|nr:uncharacterized protein BP5553_06383 [Venustampulla echinocandica]RDL35771.1 hypothetical protein BP5553_06383 [Venustampulla echinocandica]
MDLPEGRALGSPSPTPDSPMPFVSFGGSFVERVFKPTIYDDVEDPEQYTAGGLHPVHLGDLLGNNNQYKVIHKLGSGGFATVWLCRDLEKDVYTALKIMIADVSKDDCAELKLLRKTWDMEEVGGKHIAIPLDYFWIDGPNGHHLCLVLPVLGPRVSEIWDTFKDPSTLSRKIAPQVVHGLQFLHNHGICHGDLRPSNILLRVSDISSLSEEEIIEEFGVPQKDPVLTALGESYELPSAPKYLVRPIDTASINPQYLTDQICIIDFGESYDSSAPPQELGIPLSYCAPEIIFHNPAGPASDIWALACTLYEIRSCKQVLYAGFGEEDDVLLQMVQLFGKLPEPWWSSWEKRHLWFNEEGIPDKLLDNGMPAANRHTLEEFLAEGHHYTYFADGLFSGGDGEKKSFTLPTDEIKDFVDLLGQMFKYRPNERITAEVAATHPWLQVSRTSSTLRGEQERIPPPTTTSIG